MIRKKPGNRLNIYVHDAQLRRQVRAAAAHRDLSISEYCLRAITAQLIRDGERRPEGVERGGLVREAVARARRFQADAFAGQTFSVDSAELIREARRERGDE